jgi:hypothetical protein
VRLYCSNLPRDMRRRVMEYFTERATQQAMCNEQLVLNDLSPPLKAEVRRFPPPLSASPHCQSGGSQTCRRREHCRRSLARSPAAPPYSDGKVSESRR